MIIVSLEEKKQRTSNKYRIYKVRYLQKIKKEYFEELLQSSARNELESGQAVNEKETKWQYYNQSVENV